ncbi:UNVERIFIED_CONTAM: Activating signal cointegrator 1 [Siphonaria sp. JEL0065]|nr:Activating signal cointegrator 1 [Siphonaria sp. JEL0065]
MTLHLFAYIILILSSFVVLAVAAPIKVNMNTSPAVRQSLFRRGVDIPAYLSQLSQKSKSCLENAINMPLVDDGSDNQIKLWQVELCESVTRHSSMANIRVCSSAESARVSLDASIQLCTLLGLPVPSPGNPSDISPLVDEVLALPIDQALDQLRNLLGSDASDFLSEFEQRRKPTAASVNKQQNSPKFKDQTRVYRKKDNEESYLISSKLDKKKQPPPTPVQDPKVITVVPPDSAAKKQKQSSKKTYVVTTVDSIQAQGRVGNLVGLNGRPICECLAAKHGLLTNCLTCGKIICQLEGPGPCPSCGSLVESTIQQVTLIQTKQSYHHSVTVPNQHQQQQQPGKSSKKQQQHVVNRYGQVAGAFATTAITNPGGPRENETLFPTLASEKDLEALRKAEEQRERLLDYQRNSTARTRVFDTASDFDFQSDVQNKWLTAEERAIALKNMKEQERLEQERKKSRVISIDLQNRRVVHESAGGAFAGEDRRQLSYEAAKAVHAQSQVYTNENVSTSSSSTENRRNTTEPGSTGLFQNPTLRIAPKYVVPTPAAVTQKDPKQQKQQPKPSKSQIQPWEKSKQDTSSANDENKPKTMKQLRELLGESAQEIAEVGYQFTAAMQAKKSAAKREAEARKYLKVERRRVQDDYDFETSSWSIGDSASGAAAADEPACG